MKQPTFIPPAEGKLGVLLPGLGAVATTTIAGVFLARRGRALPVGSLTQMGTIRLGKRTEKRVPRIADFVPLARLDQLEFGGWDIFPDDAFESAEHANVLERRHLDEVREELQSVQPMKGVFYPGYVKRLHGTHTKVAGTKAEMVQQVREDIRTFQRERGCSRLVAVWCGSTEALVATAPVHDTIRAFEQGLATDDPAISNAQIYAWACIKERVPFANGAPNLCVDFPAAADLAREHRVPLAGKDFKTGQTLMKTILAPGFKARMLGLRVGNSHEHPRQPRRGSAGRSGEPSARRKSRNPESSRSTSYSPTCMPSFTASSFTKFVSITTRPEATRRRAGTISISSDGSISDAAQGQLLCCDFDFRGADRALDLALFLDLAQRAGFHGATGVSSFYLMSPMIAPGLYPEHDLFIQLDETQEYAALDGRRGPRHAPRRGILRLEEARDLQEDGKD